MSTAEFAFLSFIMATTFITMLLFVLFGQVTVRKLRKNPQTRDELGVEFVSGWDIVNVAQALSIPRTITKRFRQTKLSGLYANSDALYRHTRPFDRALARAFYWMLMISGLSGALLGLLNAAGVVG